MKALERFSQEIKPPAVFICHASEDKASFVLPFAAKLRGRGVHAWVDRWELRLGDSLISRIFEEGIGRADAFVPIISRSSVNKPWVREEIDSASMRRISTQLLVIPVVLKDVEPDSIPVTLQHILWVPANVADCDSAAKSIADRIFGSDLFDIPQIGPFPLQLEWEPDIGGGKCGASVVRGGFIAWEEFSRELLGGVLTRVDDLPSNSIPAVNSLQHKENWVIELEHPEHGKVGDVWVGQDPSEGWKFTGLVYVRVTYPRVLRLWRFQRYSDGFYRIVG